MKLSMSLLANYLAGYQTEIYIVAEQRSITGVRFLSDQQRYFSDYVYLGRAEEYFQDSRYRDALLLVSGENQLIVHGTDYEELLNEVLAAFEYYGGVERRLFEAAASHAPVRMVLESFGQMLPGPILVFDLEGVLLGAEHLELLEGEDDIAALKVGDHMDPKTLSKNIIDERGQLSHDLTARPQYLRIDGDMRFGCVNMYLTQDGERVGFLMIFAHSPNEVRCGMLLAEELAGYIIQTAEFTDGDSSSRSTHNLLESLLEGKTIAEAGCERIRGLLGRPDHFRVIAYRNQGIRNYTMYTLWRREMESLSVPCRAVVYEDHAVLITGAEHAEALQNSILRRYSRDTVQMGISMDVPGMEDLHRAHRQAMFALEQVKGYGIVYCRDLALSHMMQVLAADPLSTAMEHPAIAQLRVYDAANGTDLLPTLNAYLRSACHQKNTAEALHVHLNTLKYRLHRIEEVADIELTDPEEQLYLNLSLRR